MAAFKNFIKTTIVGGLMFLVPVILLAVILRHAMTFADSVARPIAAQFAESHFAGVALVTLVAALLLMLVSFLAGLVARTRAGKSLTHWVEESLLGNLPQYRMVKSMAEGLTQVEDAKGIHPALVSIEGGWQIAYFLEEVRCGWVAVFLPQSPTPMSGTIMYMPTERVRMLDMPISQAMLLIKHMGVGSAAALSGADLTAVAES